MLEPVRLSKTLSSAGTWTEYLVLFLRLMATVSLLKGLFHWAQVCGIGARPDQGFESHPTSWQAATVAGSISQTGGSSAFAFAAGRWTRTVTCPQYAA